MKSHEMRNYLVVLSAVALVLIGCESPTSALFDEQDRSAADVHSPEFASSELAENLTQELDLTATEQASLTASINDAMQMAMESSEATSETAPPASSQSAIERRSNGDVHARALWFVAARLQGYLTDQQTAKLFRAADRYGDPHLRKLVGVYGSCRGDRPGNVNSPRGVHFRLIIDLLSREQRAKAAAIFARYHEEIEAIHRKVRSGELRRAAAAEQLDALHQAMASAIRALLTDAQIRAIAERMAAGGEGGADAHLLALKQAMIEALGLRERQVSALDGLHRAQCGALQGLVERAQAGRITREEYHDGVERLVAAKVSAYAEILVGDQFEAAQIHDALLIIDARRVIQWATGGQGG